MADIVEACEQINQYIGADHDQFLSDPVVQAAAQRWLEIIGEAASRLSDDFKAKHPAVAWRDLVGMRNILVHGYFHVDSTIVWAAIAGDVPKLLDAIRPSSQR